MDATGHGLSNQGWKDSGDSIQFGDGRLAGSPVALCEVQGYAHAAAVNGAALLDAFGRPGADRWREFAAGLADRFRSGFWVEDELGAYPAIALDGAGRPVDTVTSNIGHLLGTGLLDEEETAQVVARLASPQLDSGLGLRTLSSAATGFNPYAYHGGSIWTHDTAIAIQGLRTVGTAQADAAATALLTGLLDAAPAFGYRMPELFAVPPGATTPAPYPASCRPQAWAAASAVVVVTALLGLRADVPAGTVSLAPLRPTPVGAFAVRGLQIAGRPLDVTVDASGTATVTTALPNLTLTPSPD